MRKTLILTALAATAALAALPARAGDVQWSVGISAPIGYSGSVGTMISSGPIYAPAPVYVAPAPVYYAPPPVYYAPPPVYYAPAARAYYAPPFGCFVRDKSHLPGPENSSPSRTERSGPPLARWRYGPGCWRPGATYRCFRER